MAFLNLLLISLIAVTVLADVPLEERYVPDIVRNVNDQFHNQDSFGQYKYAYINGESSKEESRSLDGVTRGSYSYMDANGVLQKVIYQADAENGFRVSGTNIPSAPLIHGSSEEITPAFSTKLHPASRTADTVLDDKPETANIQNQITNKNDNEYEDKKIIINSEEDKSTSGKYNKDNLKQEFTQQPDMSDKNVEGYHQQYLYPLAPNNDIVPLNTEYLLPFISAKAYLDYFMQQNQGFDFRERVSFLPLFQPDYIPPFARSQYRRPYAFLNGFIPIFRARRTIVPPTYDHKLEQNNLNYV